MLDSPHVFVVRRSAFALAALCGLGRGARIVVSLVALAGFVVLVTPQPSVIRAAAMRSRPRRSILASNPR